MTLYDRYMAEMRAEDARLKERAELAAILKQFAKYKES